MRNLNSNVRLKARSKGVDKYDTVLDAAGIDQKYDSKGKEFFIIYMRD